MATTDPLSPAALLLRVRRLVGSVSGHWARRYGLDRDDAFQAAALLILRRFPAFDPAAQTPEQWAVTQVRRAVGELWRRRDCEQAHGRLVPMPVAPDGHVLDLADPRAVDPAELAAAADLADVARARVAELPELERVTLAMRYGGDGATQEDVGQVLGVTGACVGDRERRALARLRAELCGGEGG